MVELGDVDHGGDGLAVLFAIAQARQRVGGLARLRDEQREPILGQRRLPVAEFGGDIYLDWEFCVSLEPVFRG